MSFYVFINNKVCFKSYQFVGKFLDDDDGDDAILTCARNHSVTI